jgi:hypothetical protein
MKFRLRCFVVAALLVAPAARAQDPDDLAVRRLLDQFQQILQAGDQAAYTSLLLPAVTATPASASRASNFTALEFRGGATRAVIQERDRQPLPGTLPGNGYRIVVDTFVEYGDRARIATWQLDLRKVDAQEWLIADQERLSAVESLYRLSVNPNRQFDARDFRVEAEDLQLTLIEGTVFTVNTDQGITGMVLLGRGEMRFSPTPETEKGQVRIFAGSDVLESRFDAAYIRMGAVGTHTDPSRLIPRPVDQRDLRKAEQLFREESAKSFTLDLGDLAREPWSLLPGGNDFVAEVRTRRFNTITYARSASEAEDISVFDRSRQRNIAVYASEDKLASRGRFYDEDDLAGYDVIGYDIDLEVSPERSFLRGRTQLRLKTRAQIANQITLRLANSLVVQSVVSEEFGRLFNLRARNQNTVLVNLPASVMHDTELTLTIVYSGRLEPQAPDREALQQGGGPASQALLEEVFPRAEPSHLYSSRSYWYPQSTISDYATATIRITVPAAFGCVATGELLTGSPTIVGGPSTATARRVYQFAAVRPVRYLAFLISRFTRAAQTTITFDDTGNGLPDTADSAAGISMSAPTYDRLELAVEANPRLTDRGRELAERATDIVRFYRSLVGDSPFQSFTLALIENALPGGHSPGYFAVLNQPLPNTPLRWTTDPANFDGFPEFFLAHELAHQWWGQAVGWQNYHEQWLSEGFSQYFAGLYAKQLRGDAIFTNVLRQWRKWSLDRSDQGPVYLGYRLGHIRNDSKVFRALVYNKGAAVLHMLRRLVGDEAFFRGLRRFYADSRFVKAGTEDFRAAMEAETGRSLERFFERWIYSASLPRLTFDYHVEGSDVVIRLEQTGELFDLPVTVTLQYADRRTVDVMVPVTERIVETRVPLAGTLRGADVSRDDGTIVEVERND